MLGAVWQADDGGVQSDDDAGHFPETIYDDRFADGECESATRTEELGERLRAPLLSPMSLLATTLGDDRSLALALVHVSMVSSSSGMNTQVPSSDATAMASSPRFQPSTGATMFGMFSSEGSNVIV